MQRKQISRGSSTRALLRNTSELRQIDKSSTRKLCAINRKLKHELAQYIHLHKKEKKAPGEWHKRLHQEKQTPSLPNSNTPRTSPSYV